MDGNHGCILPLSLSLARRALGDNARFDGPHEANGSWRDDRGRKRRGPVYWELVVVDPSSPTSKLIAGRGATPEEALRVAVRVKNRDIRREIRTEGTMR